MFDYYELKFVFHGADCKRRAADMDEARAAKKELQAAGVKEITIFGVKKGTKEIQAAKKAYVKPEFKHEPAPKVKKAPATKKKAAKATKKQKDKISKMSADDLRAIDSIFSHDGKIKILKTNTPKREPAGQLDLFDNTDKKKDEIWRFDLNELNFISMALKEFFPTYIKEPLKLTTKKYDELINCFESAKMRGGNISIKLNENETKNIIRSLMWLKEQEHVYNKDYIQEIIDGLNYGNYMV